MIIIFTNSIINSKSNFINNIVNSLYIHLKIQINKLNLNFYLNLYRILVPVYHVQKIKIYYNTKVYI